MIKIATLRQLKKQKSVKFTLPGEGSAQEGFLIYFAGKPYAYRNVCAHQRLTLDWDDNDFFTPDGSLLVCKAHGALYQPDTGACVGGPCTGASLQALPTVVQGEDIFLSA